MRRLIYAALPFALLACGSSTEAVKKVEETTTAVEEVAEVAKGWHGLEGKERGKFMKEIVMPAMKPLFQAQDPEEFAEFGCKTCHGPGAEEGEFEMPTAGIPRLDPTDQFAAHQEEDGPMLKFMGETVTPKMRDILGEEPFDPATGKGFGCFACHMMKGQDTADTPSE
jgi:hypothetical protein